MVSAKPLRKNVIVSALQSGQRPKIPLAAFMYHFTCNTMITRQCLNQVLFRCYSEFRVIIVVLALSTGSRTLWDGEKAIMFVQLVK